jgi:nucleoside phosphorylase
MSSQKCGSREVGIEVLASINRKRSARHVVDRGIKTRSIDALILTTLPGEYDAALRAGSSGYAGNPGVSGWAQRGCDGPMPYVVGRYVVADGAHFSVAIARATRTGPVAAATTAASLVERLRPRCVAMCGICAGNPAEVVLGDVIIADPAYAYDEGRQLVGGFVADHRQVPISNSWLHAAQAMSPADLPSHGVLASDETRSWFLECLYFGGRQHEWHVRRCRLAGPWRAQFEALLADGLVECTGTSVGLSDAGLAAVQRSICQRLNTPPKLPFAVEVGPMASGNRVVRNGAIWRELVERGVGRILGLDMEAATIGSVAHRLGVPNWVVVKGVSDYAGPGKSDRHAPFASLAAAEVLWKLLALRLPVRGVTRTVPVGLDCAGDR